MHANLEMECREARGAVLANLHIIFRGKCRSAEREFEGDVLRFLGWYRSYYELELNMAFLAVLLFRSRALVE